MGKSKRDIDLESTKRNIIGRNKARECNFTREELIERYESIVKRWQDSNSLIRLFPNKYEDICRKLEGLKSGAEYEIYNATPEILDMIADMGVKMGSVQQPDRLHKSNVVLKDYKKSDYVFKTNIGNIVDRIVEDKLYK